MEPHRLVLKSRAVLRDLAHTFLEGFQLRLYSRTSQIPGRYGVQQIIDPTLEIHLFTREQFAPVIAIATTSIDLLVEGSDKLADEIGGHQLTL
ncbi:hypothetical protein [Methylocella silvestris]|uniref:hypothetical protein n=1 Tax=Methylocella silvestris TaxID=199596 RepID=UPI001FE05112|nr:hypothetical protein [Methylocella silvestris]